MDNNTPSTDSFHKGANIKNNFTPKEQEGSTSKNEHEDSETVSEELDQEYQEENKNSENKQPDNTALNVVAITPKKVPFKFKRNKNGNILTVHHTIQQDKGRVVRVRLCASCFNSKGNIFVVIDKRDNVFIFDLISKHYWRLSLLVHNASIIKPFLHSPNQFLVGTKGGLLVLLDVEKCSTVKALQVSSHPISEISFPGLPLQPSQIVLLRTGCEAIIISLSTFKATHRLDFDGTRMELKFACYVPHSEQIFTCFNNDAVHIWSGVSLNTLKVKHPVKDRDRHLRLTGAKNVPEFSLSPYNSDNTEFQLNCNELDYSNGSIVCYCCQPNGKLFCICTVDGYVLLLSSYTFQLERMVHLRDFVFVKCVFLPQPPKETLLLGITSTGLVLLLDLQNTQYKLLVQLPSTAQELSISLDGKLISVLENTGMAHIWLASSISNMLKSQQECVQKLQNAFKQHKSIAPTCDNEAFSEELRQLLERDRLMAILVEYGSFPAKYRSLIWCTLLQLPCNKRDFQQLLKMNVPQVLQQQAAQLRLKQATLKRALLKVWSCLAHWCKVFAYAPFVPHLIFPFVKFYSQNALVAFEVCATLLQNHFQLWFEFHPMVPYNYLGFCENVLQHYDLELHNFYLSKEIEPIHYAWTLLMNSFSVVLDEEQWLCLWDHIISAPPYILVFCVVAYNILQREVLLRLPTKDSIRQLFIEQNPINISKLVVKSLKLMKNCPEHLHPKRYMKHFEPIPKNVYPKFLNYPQKWVMQYERDVANLQQENRVIDERIRELEVEENKMMEHLEHGLKEEEHAKRVKEIEKAYADTLKCEQERLACQRKVLLLYQKEIRNRKTEVYAALQAVERRKHALQMEKDLDTLKRNMEYERMRSETNMLLAEDELRNQELELKAQKYFAASQVVPLTQKYSAELHRLREECALLDNNIKQINSKPVEAIVKSKSRTNLDDIEKQIEEIQRQYKCLTNGKKSY